MLASFLTWSSRIVCCAIGSEMTLLVSVSMRVFPSPERHMRDAVWVGFAPEADCVLRRTPSTRAVPEAGAVFSEAGPQQPQVYHAG